MKMKLENFLFYFLISGFTVEFSSAITVLTASKLGIPISSTHCIVGSIVFVGWIYGDKKSEIRDASGRKRKKKVDWSLFRSIIYAWLVTLPASACASALLMAIIKYLIPSPSH
jgi:solute carrier family 20 (sodium-dependent phosphate transporter)